MPLPGSPQYQAILQAIVDYYREDSRVLAVILFGSLARGNWDRYSDIDLDIVIADDVTLNVLAEVAALCASFAAIDEQPALIIADGPEAADVVLQSLFEFSVRYHSLATTSPNILDSLQILTGILDADAIQRAGEANRRAHPTDLTAFVDQYLRYALEVDIALRRERLWLALDLLHRMRHILMQIYAVSRHAPRALHYFESHADQRLQADLAKLLPQRTGDDIHRALVHALDLLEDRLNAFSATPLQLNPAQHHLLRQLWQRL